MKECKITQKEINEANRFIKKIAGHGILFSSGGTLWGSKISKEGVTIVDLLYLFHKHLLNKKKLIAEGKGNFLL